MKEICAPVIALIDRLGDMACFLAEAFRQTFRTRRLVGKVMRQVYVIGANSMFVILLIGLFTGLVLGLQAFRINTPCVSGSPGSQRQSLPLP